MGGGRPRPSGERMPQTTVAVIRDSDGVSGAAVFCGCRHRGGWTALTSACVPSPTARHVLLSDPTCRPLQCSLSRGSPSVTACSTFRAPTAPGSPTEGRQDLPSRHWVLAPSPANDGERPDSTTRLIHRRRERRHQGPKIGQSAISGDKGAPSPDPHENPLLFSGGEGR